MSNITAALLSALFALVGYVFIDFKRSVQRILAALEKTINGMEKLLLDHERRIKNLEHQTDD